MSHESVLSAGGACACLAPRPRIPPFEAALLRVGVASEVFALGRLMPSAPSMSLEPLEASAGGRPGRASSTAIVVRNVRNRQVSEFVQTASKHRLRQSHLSKIR